MLSPIEVTAMTSIVATAAAQIALGDQRSLAGAFITLSGILSQLTQWLRRISCEFGGPSTNRPPIKIQTSAHSTSSETVDAASGAPRMRSTPHMLDSIALAVSRSGARKTTSPVATTHMVRSQPRRRPGVGSRHSRQP